MKTRPIALCRLFVAAVFALSGLSAHAVLLNPGDFAVPLPGTSVALEPQLAGSVLIDELIPFSFSAGVGLGNITGQVQQRIVQSSMDGTLDFY